MNPSLIIIILSTLESTTFTPARIFAEDLNKSLKTTRILLKTLQSDLANNGALIEVKKHHGYKLLITDSDKYSKYKQTLEKTTKTTTSYGVIENRVMYLIDLLLRNQQPVRIDDIANTLFVSRSSIQNDLTHVRKFLEPFNLTIESKPYYGMFVSGPEVMIRSALVSYYTLRTKHNQFHDYFEHPLYKIINESLYSFLHDSNITLSAIAFHDILLHLFIAYQRNTTHDTIPNVNPLFPYHIHTLFYDLEKATSISLSKPEQHFYTALINSRQTLQDSADLIDLSQQTTRIKDSLRKLRTYYDVDFLMDHAYDNVLITNLTLQFATLMQRVQLNAQLRNPYKKHIQQHYILSFHMAKLFCRILDATWQHKISDDEISFVAPYFEVALTQRILSSNMKNVTYVLDADVGFQQLQKNQYLTLFPHHIRSLSVISTLELATYDLSKTDLLISTVALQREYHIPTLIVPLILDASNKERINVLLRKTRINFHKPIVENSLFESGIVYSSLNECLSNQAEKIAQITGERQETILESLLLSDAHMYSFIQNRILVVIPLQTNTSHTVSTFSILKKSIRENNHQIKGICVIYNEGSFNRNLMRYYEILSEVFSNASIINDILDTGTYESWQAHYHSLETQLLLK